MAHYCWSDLYNGGKTKKVDLPNGGSRTVVVERNVIARGEKVTKKQLGVSDEEWDALVESGSIRPYKLPEGADEHISPTQAFLRSFVDPRTGEADPAMLMEMSLAQPLPELTEEEQGDLPVGV